MDTVKTAIFIACIMGIVSAMIDISAPEGSSKKQLLVIAGIITMLAVITPFTASGFKLSLDEFSVEQQTDYYERKLDYEAESAILSSAEKKYEEYFSDKLNSNSIKVGSVEIRLSMSDGFEVTAESITIVLHDFSQESQARELIREDLPEIQIEVLSEDENEV